MNQFYTFENKSISTKSKNGLEFKSQPSDMVMRNILNYSLSLSVLKSKRVKQNKMRTIQLILN